MRHFGGRCAARFRRLLAFDPGPGGTLLVEALRSAILRAASQRSAHGARGARTTNLRESFVHDLGLAGYAERTRDAYVASFDAFVRFHGRPPRAIGQRDARRWVRHLTEQGQSPSRLRQHFAALRFLYARTLGRPEVVAFLTWPAERAALPVVPSPEEVASILGALRSPTYRTFFATLYATGLRIQEATRLTTSDVDAARGVIVVRHGKGGRERLVMLGARLLELLRAYWWLVRPASPWLFATRRGRPLCAEVARRALHAAARECSLGKRITPHSFRHAFATHMLERGADLRLIQVVLGHASIRSTVRYARVSTAMIAGARSPLDDLPSFTRGGVD